MPILRENLAEWKLFVRTKNKAKGLTSRYPLSRNIL